MPTENITDLRDRLVEVFDCLREKTMEPKDAFEINNTAGKIISTVKLQLAHAALCGTVPDIPFLGPTGVPVAGLPNSAASIGELLAPADDGGKA